MYSGIERFLKHLFGNAVIEKYQFSKIILSGLGGSLPSVKRRHSPACVDAKENSQNSIGSHSVLLRFSSSRSLYLLPSDYNTAYRILKLNLRRLANELLGLCASSVANALNEPSWRNSAARSAPS